jgi:hypothetical protein
MSLARSYNRSLKNEINAFAAWFPVTNTFAIGDYGLIEDGVFRSIGNITAKYPDIDLSVKEGPAAKINFSSAGTRSMKIGANGEVDSFASLGNAEAKLKLHFEKENSIVLKANLTSKQLNNIEEVALKLVAKSSWNRKYKVVSTVYSGEQCVVICSSEAGTEVVLEAKANILKQVEAGKVDGTVSMTSSKKGVFESIGESGVVGLDLFRAGLRGPKLLADIKPEDVEIEKGVENIDDDF